MEETSVKLLATAANNPTTALKVLLALLVPLDKTEKMDILENQVRPELLELP